MGEKKAVLLTKYIPDDKNASQKAPKDIEDIFEKNYGRVYRIYYTNRKIIRNIDLIRNYLKLKLLKGKKDTILFVQWPLYSRKPFQDDFVFKLGFKKIVAVIHDIDSLRFFPDDVEKINKDIDTFNKFDALICHNSHMSDWLRTNGVKVQIINLNLFDYLGENLQDIVHRANYRIVFAGNLNKSVFLKDIDAVLPRPIIGYGLLTEFDPPQNMIYKGSYAPNKLREAIEGEFGLIWDGESSESCLGKNGNYMKFNNPHKLSLYISCGLPIITWSKAAIADFVIDHKIGFVVDNLNQVNSILTLITDKEYQVFLDNVNKLRTKVLRGAYTVNAIQKVMELL